MGYCARCVLDMTPVWPFNLQRLLGGLRTAEFQHCNRLLLSVYVMEDSSQQVNLVEQLVLSQSRASSSPPSKKAEQETEVQSTVMKKEPSPPPTPSPQIPATDEGYVSKSSFVLTPNLDETDN